jgi:chaperonin GroES
MKQLRLLGGMVLIERDARQDRVSPDSPIIIPPAAMRHNERERYETGKIVAMGPGMKVGVSRRWKPGEPYRWPMPPVSVGDRVLYRTWAVRAEEKDERFDIVSDESIDAVIFAEAINPVFDRVTVRRIESPDTIRGIVIPEIARARSIKGEVVAVGSGRVRSDGTIRKLDVMPGNHVVFGPHAGTEVVLFGKRRIILREDDILAVVTPCVEVTAA